MSTGLEIILAALTTLPESPGVYRMVNEAGQMLYVGKARNIKKRVTSYTLLPKLPQRLKLMVFHTRKLEFTTTHTEVEALLLESNLIKHHQPRYNILLKDDKSFPYIMIDESTDFPRIAKQRLSGGAERKKNASYFGPYVEAWSVKAAIAAIQRSFLIRPCTDSFFANRTRPCMEYQIKRCSAPCVDKISVSDYATLVNQSKLFLSGRTREVQELLSRQMMEASEAMNYEKAAKLRDRIHALNRVQTKNIVRDYGLEEADVIALYQDSGLVCIQVFFIRNSTLLGNRPFFPLHTEEHSDAEIIAAFLGRFYQSNIPPKIVLTSHVPEESELMTEALCTWAERKVELYTPSKGPKQKLMELALKNSEQALDRKRREEASEESLLKLVAECFQLPKTPQRIEVYDNSHIMGKHAIGAMIVAGKEGFNKNAYRRFNVDPQSLSGGNDFAMMREVLTRRFAKLTEENMPDFLLIDGGKAHMGVVESVFKELNIEIPFACIAKGPDRNAGREIFHQPGREPFSLPAQDPLLYYLQRLRDEAHRFAIFTHRDKRGRAMKTSSLDRITGIGPTRKKALLTHFGSVKAIRNASVEELQKVEGISFKTAEQILQQLS